MPSSVLVVDDEPHIREVISFALERAGLQTIAARNGAEALATFRRTPADLVVLDIGMPEMDGLEVCRQLRRNSDVPILFLSARTEEVDRIVGLEMGGDDYVTKPFSPRELVARIRAILKRTRPEQAATGAILRHDTVTLDPDSHEVRVGGQKVDLTAREFALLEAFLSRPTHVYSRSQLLDRAWGENVHLADRTIDSHIRNLRAKFAALGSAEIINTVHGVGFRLGTPRKSASE